MKTAERLDVMPAAPKGTVWELKLCFDRNDMFLYLNARNWLTGKPTLREVGRNYVKGRDGWAQPLSASDDEIVERVIVAARRILQDIKEKPQAKAAAQLRAATLAARLGIQVQVSDR